MNNDISSELTSYINPRTTHATKKSSDVKNVQSEKTYSNDSYEAAQKYLDTLGHAKVSMDQSINNRISNSINMLKKDPEYVQNHIDFCDMLQEQGYSLEDAVIGTDIIFEKLKDESTYKP